MPSKKSIHTLIPGVSVVLIGLTLPALAQQSYTFTKVVDASSQRPDGKGLFSISTTTTPAFDGQWVVFRDFGPADDASLQAIWSFNTRDGTFHKLADLHTVMPGGTVTFSELHLLDTAPTVRNGTVIFLARYNAGSGPQEGLYSVPAAGGQVVKVADYTTADPTGGQFTMFDSSGLQMGGFSFDGTTVAFHGQGSTSGLGIYAANPDGSSLALVADNSHPYSAAGASVNRFTSPAVSGGNVVVAGTAGDPATAYSGLYLGKAQNSGALSELVNSGQQLPGNSNTSFHTRFDAPYMGFDGSLVAFHADDAAAPNATPFSGLYWTDLSSHTINKIADLNSILPGLGKLQAVAAQGVAVSQGNVLFRAADSGSPAASGLYLWANGTATRVVGTGDVLGGGDIQVIHDPGPGALSGAGFVFVSEFGAARSFAMYYATPTLANYSSASYLPFGPLAPDSIASVFGQGLADAPGASSVPPLPATLANATLSVKDSAGVTRSAPLYYAGPTQINYVVPDGTALGAATVTVAKGSQPVATGTIQVAAVSPGLFTQNASGSGAAAAIALKIAASGATSYTYAATCSAPGNCVTAPIDLGLATDQVYLELYGTGIRGYKTGITATIGGTPTATAPAFAVQPQYPGMDQVNVLLDRGLIGRGEMDVVLTVDGVAANTVRINVK
jgi:uncharacterized protein (TIGR03437 family)